MCSHGLRQLVDNKFVASCQQISCCYPQACCKLFLSCNKSANDKLQQAWFWRTCCNLASLLQVATGRGCSRPCVIWRGYKKKLTIHPSRAPHSSLSDVLLRVCACIIFIDQLALLQLCITPRQGRAKQTQGLSSPSWRFQYTILALTMLKIQCHITHYWPKRGAGITETL